MKKSPPVVKESMINRTKRCCLRGGPTIPIHLEFVGCTNIRQKGGVCRRHGAVTKRCNFKGGCNNGAKQGGVCRRHGAIVKVCWMHGAKRVKGERCHFMGCYIFTQVNEGTKVTRCSVEGCTKQEGRFCIMHGVGLSV